VIAMLATLPKDRNLPVAQDYVLAKIERVCTEQKSSQQRKRLENSVKYRQHLARSEQQFKQDLNRAVSKSMREGLGIKVVLNQQALPHPQFMAEFQFLGKRWLITRRRTLLGCQWNFTAADQGLCTFCSSANLENRLCYALGKYKRGVALLPTATTLRVV
jgi:hypothetical protein